LVRDEVNTVMTYLGLTFFACAVTFYNVSIQRSRLPARRQRSRRQQRFKKQENQVGSASEREPDAQLFLPSLRKGQ